MLELLAGAAVTIAALALVLEPLARGASRRPVARDEDDDLDLTPIEESESPKVQALLALKEIEFDRATGKLSDEDYGRLKATYSQKALEAIDTEAQRERADQVRAAVVATADDPAEALIREARSQLRLCPQCGPRPEADAAFCSECGRRLT